MWCKSAGNFSNHQVLVSFNISRIKIAFLLHFTVRGKKKPGSTFIMVLGNCSTKISKFRTNKFHTTVGYNSVNFFCYFLKRMVFPPVSNNVPHFLLSHYQKHFLKIILERGRGGRSTLMSIGCLMNMQKNKNKWNIVLICFPKF